VSDPPSKKGRGVADFPNSAFGLPGTNNATHPPSLSAEDFTSFTSFMAESVKLDVSREKDGKFALRGGGSPMRGQGCFRRQRLPQTHGETLFGRGCVTRNGEFKLTPDSHRYVSREVVLGPVVDEGHNRGSKRLLILTLVLVQEA
jgi:hypothetical protein